MKTGLFHKSSWAFLLLYPVLCWAQAQEPKTLRLNEPNKKRGLPVMQALSVRASVREWSDKDLSLQDLSDLLWAANGINRPESKKRTAASAMNAQDVDIYTFMKEGIYLYDAAQHALIPVAAGDFREEILTRRSAGGPGAQPGSSQPSEPPVQLILVSDASRFGSGTPELKHEWGAIDTGIVSQNIALFCAATGLVTRPRAAIDKDRIKEILKLEETHNIFLNHPVGYPK